MKPDKNFLKHLDNISRQCGSMKILNFVSPYLITQKKTYILSPVDLKARSFNL